MDRNIRNLLHLKQRKSIISSGSPKVADLEEGVPVFRITEEGIVQFIRINNGLYKSVFSKSSG